MSAKKTYGNSISDAINAPAMAFISQAEPVERQQPKRAAPSKETRSRRMQLLFKPSLVEAIQAKAAAQGVSMNDLINRILEKEMGRK